MASRAGRDISIYSAASPGWHDGYVADDHEDNRDGGDDEIEERQDRESSAIVPGTGRFEKGKWVRDVDILFSRPRFGSVCDGRAGSRCRTCGT